MEAAVSVEVIHGDSIEGVSRGVEESKGVASALGGTDATWFLDSCPRNAHRKSHLDDRF